MNYKKNLNIMTYKKHKLKSDIYNKNIPVNDIQAYKYYPKYNFIYNKLFIAKSQNLNCGTSNPNIPSIVRPIINLYGMGSGVYFLDHKSKNLNIPNKNFWCEILKGEHISIDIFKNSYGIQDSISFKGISNDDQTFDYWEYIDFIIPNNIKNWINFHLYNFIGIINIELIGDKIIECHLRMGDLNFFKKKKLIREVIKCYNNKKISIPKLLKIYLIPIFSYPNSYKVLRNNKFKKILKKYDKYIYSYHKDSYKLKKVSNRSRLYILAVTNKNIGMHIRNIILNKIYK